MPPRKRKVRTHKKTKKAAEPADQSPREPSPPPPPPNPLPQQEGSTLVPQLSPEVDPNSDDNGSVSLEARTKTKRVYNNFTERQEDLIVELLQDNPILYNKCLKEYKNKEKKDAMWTEMAVKLDIPEALLHKWYKTMRTQYGKLIQKKSGDGARDYTDRERWMLTKFAFLKSHIVRVASSRIGFPKEKSGPITTVLPSDESDMDDDEEETPIDREIEGPSQSTASSSTATASSSSKGGKKKKTPKDTDLQELIDKLSDRVEGSKELREKVTDMVKSLDNPHTAYANYLASMHPSIHPDLWDDYLRKSHETLMFYVGESKRIRRVEERPQVQPQPQAQRYGPTFTQLQPIVQQQSQQSTYGQCSHTQPGGSDEMWGTASHAYRNAAMSTPDPPSVPQVSQIPYGSLVTQLEDISGTQ